MDSRRESQINKQRAIRHTRLMRMIKGYCPSQEQVRKLERIKTNTMMEINIRYMRCDHNRHYKFPKNKDQEDSEEEREIITPLARRENFSYDLRLQNQPKPNRTLSQKVLSYDGGRRIASLEVEKINHQRERFLRLHMKSNKLLSSKGPTRKNSVSQRSKLETLQLKLPQLKQKPKHYLKTEGRVQEQVEVRQVIGKKLLTENAESPLKLKGLDKYLQKAEIKQKQQQNRSNFKKKLFLPDKI